VILVLVGSARKQSINDGLVEELQHFKVDSHVHLKLIIPDLERLPIFSLEVEKQICKG
jgi:NAD(P)H-dependent FMN reductase